MGQEVSCCRQRTNESGIEKIFDSNTKIVKEQIQVLGPDNDMLYPSRKSKLIKLQKVPCFDNAKGVENSNGLLNTTLHSRNLTSTSQTLRESNYQRSGDNNQIYLSYDGKGNMNTNNFNNNYLSNNTYGNSLSTQETFNNYSSQNQYASNNNAYVSSPSSYDIDQYQQVSNQSRLAAVNPDQIYSVRETYIDGSTYEGEKLKEVRHGYGVFIFSNKACYKGNWSQDKMNGRGQLYYSSGQLAYQGQFNENKFEGYGYLNNEVVDNNLSSEDDKYYLDFSTIGSKWTKYEGEFQNDAKNGRGRLYFVNGDFIQADFIDDKIHGECILYKANNTNIKGYWRENKLIRITY